MYHVEGRLVMAAPRQIVGMVSNCTEILEEVVDNSKMHAGGAGSSASERGVLWQGAGACANFGKSRYRKDLQCDLQEAREVI